RNALEKFMVALRQEFVFDNVAVYIQGEEAHNLEIVFACAMGRSSDAEADAAWGEDFAGQVVKKGQLLLRDPSPSITPDGRLHQAYLLGLPFYEGDFVR